MLLMIILVSTQCRHAFYMQCLMRHVTNALLRFCHQDLLCLQLEGTTCTLHMLAHGPADAWLSET